MRILLAAIAFELVNLLLMAGISKTLFGIPVFHNFTVKLRELAVPVSVSLIVVPRFLNAVDTPHLLMEVGYTSFFLLILLLFSNQYIKQIIARQNTSKEFIELLENRVTHVLTGHGKRVGMICDILIEELGYSKNKKHNLIQMAIIHDIGKSLLPSHVFRKRGSLTLSEEEQYKNHSIRGAEIVRSIFPNDRFTDWILYHHEQWDGRGFPEGLKGEQIPLEARIIALCNQLDHIMRRHTDDETVHHLLYGLGGTLLDPSLTKKIDIDTISYIRECIPVDESVTIEEVVHSEIESEVRTHIGQSFFLRYTFDNKLVGPTEKIPKSTLIELATLAKVKVFGFHEMIVHEGKTFDVHFQPFDQDVVIFVEDITSILEYRKNTDRLILEAYQDVIRSLSENKITLCLTSDELINYIGDYKDSILVKNKEDVTASRGFLDQYLDDVNSKAKMWIQIAVSEATTNLVKHATEGEVSVYLKNGILQVLITDKGSGIPLHELPKTILISGYSSKRSLGKGFSVMAKAASKILLYTFSGGTSILLEFSPEILRGSRDKIAVD